MQIEVDLISAVLECEQCKKMFTGEHAAQKADLHAIQSDHIVSGTLRHYVAFGKKN